MIVHKKILNQIYGILAELQKQGKQIILCKVPPHIGTKGNKQAGMAATQAIDMPYYLTIRRDRNFEWQRELENNTTLYAMTILETYTTLNNALKSGKAVGNACLN